MLCLRRLVPPRVKAAVLGMILNRWTTGRRMKGLRGQVGCCVLGCSRTAADSIEHYTRCRAIRTWMRARLEVEAGDVDVSRWMLATPLTDRELSIQAVAIYVSNKVVHHMRRKVFRAGADRETYANHFMNQQFHEARRRMAFLVPHRRSAL